MRYAELRSTDRFRRDVSTSRALFPAEGLIFLDLLFCHSERCENLNRIKSKEKTFYRAALVRNDRDDSEFGSTENQEIGSASEL